MSLIWYIAILSFAKYVSTDKLDFIGQDDAEICNILFGYEATIPTEVTDFNPCLIYCELYGKVYATARPPKSVCGKQSICVDNKCFRNDINLGKICLKSNKKYVGGAFKNPDVTCKISCYGINRVVENINMPFDTPCATAANNGQLGSCGHTGTCLTETLPLLRSIYNAATNMKRPGTMVDNNVGNRTRKYYTGYNPIRPNYNRYNRTRPDKRYNRRMRLDNNQYNRPMYDNNRYNPELDY